MWRVKDPPSIFDGHRDTSTFGAAHACLYARPAGEGQEESDPGVADDPCFVSLPGSFVSLVLRVGDRPTSDL